MNPATNAYYKILIGYFGSICLQPRNLINRSRYRLVNLREFLLLCWQFVWRDLIFRARPPPEKNTSNTNQQYAYTGPNTNPRTRSGSEPVAHCSDAIIRARYQAGWRYSRGLYDLLAAVLCSIRKRLQEHCPWYYILTLDVTKSVDWYLITMPYAPIPPPDA